MSGQDETKTRWSEMRDLFAATREAMIVIAVLMILVAPSIVRASLQRAGITAFAGVEFDVEQVVNAGQQVALAEAEVASLSQQLASIELQLAALSQSRSPARPEQLKQIADSVHSLQAKASDANQTLAETSQKIDRAIQLMPPDQLRELADRNRRRANASGGEVQPLPRLDSAQVQNGFSTMPNTPGNRISR